MRLQTLGGKRKSPHHDRQPTPRPKGSVLNYRHHFHAGNFADLVKHAVLLALLERLTAQTAPLTVIDTHAGAGLYDLTDDKARRSKEAEVGIARLMADGTAPAVFDPLKAAVRAANESEALRFYPGSPLLTAGALRLGDRYLGFELRTDDQAALQTLLRARVRSGVKAEARLGDGYGASGEASTGRGRSVVYLIDPPFERGDEYDRIVETVATARRASAPTFAIWTPIKDLETFDAILRRLEALHPGPIAVAEVRLRPLTDPMKMNGCAMVLIDAPDLIDDAQTICRWVASHCGEEGANGRVFTL
jgi:23S rRNA (adenine2030-N6)-methyltransferase